MRYELLQQAEIDVLASRSSQQHRAPTEGPNPSVCRMNKQ
jgi:hypothetical protein